MDNYLGEFPVDLKTHPIYGKYTKSNWAMHWLESYGQIDGDHHKAWVLDQIAQILKGTSITIVKACWQDGTTEYRFNLDEPSKSYVKWRKDMQGEYNSEEDEYEYGYEEGIAP